MQMKVELVAVKLIFIVYLPKPLILKYWFLWEWNCLWRTHDFAVVSLSLSKLVWYSIQQILLATS